MAVQGYTVRSLLTGFQVTSRPRDRFSRYSKWLDTCRTALVYNWPINSHQLLRSLPGFNLKNVRIYLRTYTGPKLIPYLR